MSVGVASRANHIAMVAGEPSGDLLAAQILRGIQQQQPTPIQFSGIGGPQMQAASFQSVYPMDALSVFGYVDALKRLPTLLRTYHGLKKQLLQQRPDVFVGIDAPDFNLRIEHVLRQNTIPTVQFVGPSIWAWRYERIHRIREAVSHMLVLFPFEVPIYEKEGIPVTCVGHPLAQHIPLQPDQAAARTRLNVEQDARVLGILPGSRQSEVALLGPRFLQTAQQLQQRDPDLQFLVPMVNPARCAQFQALLQQYPVNHLHVLQTDSMAPTLLADGSVKPIAWEVMEASDALLVASGTASLEAALYKCPMVISYVLSPLMKRIMAWQAGQDKPLLEWVGLPNILSQDFVVPELLQDDATPAKLAQACEKALCDDSWRTKVKQRFVELHQSLRLDTPRLAAEVILNVAEHGY